MEISRTKSEDTLEAQQEITYVSAGKYALESVELYPERCRMFNAAEELILEITDTSLRNYYLEKIKLRHSRATSIIPDEKNPGKCSVHNPNPLPDIR